MSALTLPRDVQSSPSLPVQNGKTNNKNLSRNNMKNREPHEERGRKRKKRRKITIESNSKPPCMENKNSDIKLPINNNNRKKKRKRKKIKKIEIKKEEPEVIIEEEIDMKNLNELEKLKLKFKKSYNEFNYHFEEIGKEIGPHNYQIVALLGVGAQGRVYLVRLIDTGELYAMKVVLKEQIIDNDKVTKSNIEKNKKERN